MNYISLGRNIRRLRQERLMTQERLAEEIQISPSFIGHIERGSRKASMETVIKIANALQIGLDVLLYDDLNFPLSIHKPMQPMMRDIMEVIQRHSAT